MSELGKWPCYRVIGEPDLDSPRTYAIFGIPRGGTSMVGGLARLCGLPLGDELPNNHEDPDFNFDLLRRDGQDPIARILAAIERRDAAHAVWGWKYPRAIRYLDEIRTRLRNPHLILVLRDPVAAGGRVIRKGQDALTTVQSHQELQTRNLDLAARWQVPTLLVSYERSADRPFRTAQDLAEFLGMPAPTDREQVRAFVQPGTYQDLP
jgi:hypothetical protein